MAALDDKLKPVSEPGSRQPSGGPSARKLGEELPIFCENCGYSLNALPSIRCEHCQILQFVCPECGHHQPINTLRPAVQRVIGRVRAGWLAGMVFFKLNFFGWLLFAWGGMGAAWSYQYMYSGYGNPTYNFDMILGFTCFAMPFAMVGRMLLLRWRSGALIGLFLAALVIAALLLGWWVEALSVVHERLPKDYKIEFANWFPAMIPWAGFVIIVSSVLVWPIWVGLVRVFLPRALGENLLEWQRSLSSRSAAGLARE